MGMPTGADLIARIDEILDVLIEFEEKLEETTGHRYILDKVQVAIIELHFVLDAILKCLKGGILDGSFSLGPIRVKIERDNRYEWWWKNERES